MGLSSSRVGPPVRKRPISIQERFPSGRVYEALQGAAADVADLESLLRGQPTELSTLLAGKTTILIGVPGPFTPVCTQHHLPGYVSAAKDFLSAGADQILCLTAADVFAAHAWSESLGASEAGVRVLADPLALIAAAAGLRLDLTGSLGRPVYRRFAAVVEDGVVRLLHVEADGLGMHCTTAVPLLGEFKTGKYKRMFA